MRSQPGRSTSVRRAAGPIGLASFLVLSGCVASSGVPAAARAAPHEPASPSAAPSAEAPVSAASSSTAAVPLAVRWSRGAAEHRAIFEEVYAWAAERVAERARGRAAGTWAVIMDADETVLDNTEYQVRRARLGLGFTPESWTAWVREEAAPALPGAVAFVRRVRALGGRVVIVTNRTRDECAPTRRNLQAVGLTVVGGDAVLAGARGRRACGTRGLRGPLLRRAQPDVRELDGKPVGGGRGARSGRQANLVTFPGHPSPPSPL